MKQFSDLPKRIVVERVGGSDRPEGPPGTKGPQAQRAPTPEGPPGLKGPHARRASRPEGLPSPKGLQAVLSFCPSSLRFTVLARILPL